MKLRPLYYRLDLKSKKIPKGFYVLARGEKMKIGDYFWCSGCAQWEETHYIQSKDNDRIYIRRIVK